MGLENDSDWQTVYNGFHLATNESPIAPILIPGVFTRHTIRIYATSLSAKSHWWLAGDLSHLLGSNNAPVFEGTRCRVPLKKIMLIRLPKLTATYRLLFQVPRWHKEIALVVEVYTGE